MVRLADRLGARLHKQRARLFSLLLASVAFLCLAGGIDSIWQQVKGPAWRPHRLPAAIALVLCGLAQLAILRRALRRPPAAASHWQRGNGRPTFPVTHAHLPALPGGRAFVRWLVCGALVSYVAVLALGPGPYLRYVFRGGIGAWYTVCLTVWILQADIPAAWRSLSMRPVPRLCGTAVFHAACLLILVESSLRVVQVAAGGLEPSPSVALAYKLPTGSPYQGGQINGQGYWDDEFQMVRRPGVLRIAALGQGLPLSGTVRTNCLTQLERQMDAEVYNFGVPASGPREQAAQCRDDVWRYQPDLVLLFVNVGTDITQAPKKPDHFDMRGLSLYQVCSRWLTLETGAAPPPVPPSTYEGSLAMLAGELTVFRTPTPSYVERQWQECLGGLRKVAATCKARGTPLVLVVVPSACQADPRLCAVVSRRSGCPQSQLDLGLPQRRLRSFADAEELGLIDLLPHLQTMEQPAFSTDGNRLTTDGHALTAHLLAGWLQARDGDMLAGR